MARCPGLAARDSAQAGRPGLHGGWAPVQGQGEPAGPSLGVGPWRGAQDTETSCPPPPAPCPQVSGHGWLPWVPAEEAIPRPSWGGLWELMEGVPEEAVGGPLGVFCRMSTQHPQEGALEPGGTAESRERSWWGARRQPTVSGPVVSCGVRRVRCWPPGARIGAGGQGAPSHPRPHAGAPCPARSMAWAGPETLGSCW